MSRQFSSKPEEYSKPYAAGVVAAVYYGGGVLAGEEESTNSIVIQPRVLLPGNIALKRAFDVTVALLAGIFILSWLLPVLALLVKLDSRGPVFFKQRRHGQNGLGFSCIKLRTMVPNDCAHTHTAVANDSRITRIGRFLRATHLDELPQFYNVLAGHMSVVGPRPHMVYENKLYAQILPGYWQRNRVKPGITGLAQSYGFHGAVGGHKELETKLEYDLYYIQHWSFRMDVAVIIRTALNLLG